MTCTAPINISYVSNQCDSKCDYQANYSDSVCVATKMPNYIACRYDTNSAQSVTYNTKSYYVSEIRIYKPSLHTYNGNYADAEIIIMHKTSNTENMLVCIPVKTDQVTNVNKIASQNLADIIKTTATCNSDCEVVFDKTNSMFNLNNFIPSGVPFYTYSGTFPWCESSVGNVNYIVFDVDTFHISCPSSQLILMPTNTYSISKIIPELFINPKGVNKNISSNVYIDCVPVETSVNETTMYSNASAMPTTLSLPAIDVAFIWTYLNYFIVIVVVILLIMGWYKVMPYLKPPSK